MTEHFNRLSASEDERLTLLIEECSEVIQAACKIQRHGYESVNPLTPVPEDELPWTNRALLEKELGDLNHAIRRMTAAHDIKQTNIDWAENDKSKQIGKYLHHA